MVFNNLLDPILSPIKQALHPLVFVVLVAFLVSVIIIVVYKLMTDQTKMKDLKDRQKEFQKRMKALKKEPEKAMKVQKEAMSVNMEYMKSSMKPTLITFLPIIIIFGWMNANMAFLPIMPDAEFGTTLEFTEGTHGNVTVMTPDEITIIGLTNKEINENQVNFQFKGPKGDYLLVFDYAGTQYNKEIRISEDKYAPVIKLFKKQPLKTITLNNQKRIVSNLFGWKLGWLGTYIILSIVFSMGLRKLFKIY